MRRYYRYDEEEEAKGVAMLYVDTESVGLTGPIVTIQTAVDDDEPEIYHVWENTVQETLDYIEGICEQPVCLFNATHDSFQLHKLYNIFAALSVNNKDKLPDPEEIEVIEKLQPRDYCLRPPRVQDIYVHLKRGMYQWLAKRGPIEIFSIPIQAAQSLIEWLDEWTVKNLPPILFARRGDKRINPWKMQEIEGKPGFVNLVLDFGGTLALKPITAHHFNVPVVGMEMPYHYYPEEYEFAPWKCKWRNKLQQHIHWWKTNPHAIKYATDDIRHLQRWAKELNIIKFNTNDGDTPVDIDSCLAWMVGGIRYHGLAIDNDAIKNKLAKLEEDMNKVPTAPAAALSYIKESLSPIEALTIKNTSKQTLKGIIRHASNDEAKSRALSVLNIRKDKKRIELLEKLLVAGRFYPNFNIVGTLSNRMSGTSGINPQGIAKEKEIRSLFLLADKDSDWTLSGGDFDGQEVTIAARIYNDENLTRDLLAGKSIHQILASVANNVSYDDPRIAKGTTKYDAAKGGVFSLIYGAQVPTFAATLGLEADEGAEVYEQFGNRYPGVKKARAITFDKFCPMKQPGGQGSKVIWGEPERYSYSLGGYRRDFYLENLFCKLLFDTANKLPFKLPEGKVERKKGRIQTITGATTTALYGAAFRIQQQNMAAAANNEIQATGAEITKRLQYSIYHALQPYGVFPYQVLLLNIHDEVLAVSKRPDKVKEVVNETVMEMKKDIPLLAMKWKTGLSSWGDMK